MFKGIKEVEAFVDWTKDWILMVVLCSFGGIAGLLVGEVSLPEAVGGSFVVGSLFYGLTMLTLWVEDR